MELTCLKCGYKWDYNGKAVFGYTCPKCRRKNRVWIEENFKYSEFGNCEACGKHYRKKYKNSKYCDPQCQRVAASKLGRAALQEKNYDFTGENNPNWKGGISKNHYHYKKIQVERYPERVRARKILRDAVRDGKITPPERCQSCNKIKALQGHHEDYEKPYDVKWLCKKCHDQIHNISESQ